MSLGSNTNNTIFINIKNGNIVRKEGGEEKFYDYIEGELLDIITPTRVYNNEEVKVWYFKIKGKDNEDYILSIGYKSGVARAILNSLASAEDYKEVKILPYEKDTFTKIVVYSHGEKLKWKYDKIPPIEIKQIKGEEVKHDSERIRFFDNLSKEILEKLNK